MPKIAYVKAWGLWSHYESVFEASPGLTVITGANGSGKSSILRWIRWVFFGEPEGEDFLFLIRDEQTGEIIKQAIEGKAEVGLDNGVVITKTRRKGKTTYAISTLPDVFEKAEVPQEVKDALGLTKQSFGDYEKYLNFIYQADGPFLLNETGSVGAKVLGKLAGTEVVDLAIKSFSKKSYAARQELTAANKAIEKYNSDLLQYKDLETLKQQLNACEFLLGEVEQAATRADNIKALTHSLGVVTDRIGALSFDLERLAVVPDLAVDLENIEKAQRRYDIIGELYRQYLYDVSTLETLDEGLTAYKTLDEAKVTMESLDGDTDRYSRLTELYQRYTAASKTVTEAQATLDKLADLDVASATLAITEVKVERLQRLKDLLDTYYNLGAVVRGIDSQLEQYQGLEEAARLIADVEVNFAKASNLRTVNQLFTIKDRTYQDAGRNYTTAVQTYEAAEKELKAAWDESGGVCPLCDQPIGSHSHG